MGEEIIIRDLIVPVLCLAQKLNGQFHFLFISVLIHLHNTNFPHKCRFSQNTKCSFPTVEGSLRRQEHRHRKQQQRRRMTEPRKERKILIAFTGAAALLVIGVNVAVYDVSSHKKKGIFDQIIHSPESVDIAGLLRYLHPKVFAADLFASKFLDNLFNQHAGMQFRNKE